MHFRTIDHEDDDLADDIGPGRSKKYYPDTYLDSPILAPVIEKTVAILASPVRTGRDISFFERTIYQVKERLPTWNEYKVISVFDYPNYYRMNWPSTLSSDYADAISDAAKIWDTVQKSLKNWTGTAAAPIDQDAMCWNAIEWYHRWSGLDSITMEIERQSATSGPNVISAIIRGKYEFTATKDMIWLHIIPLKKKLLLSYDQFLMMKDLFFSRAQIFTATATFYKNDPELISLIKGTMDWHEKCLDRHGNPGFEVLKQTEALSKAYLSAITDQVFGEDGPYGRMLEKVREKERKLGTEDDFLADDFDRVLRSSNNPVFITEIFGLLKISGHPLVDPALGGRSAAEEATSPDLTSQKNANRIRNAFCRCILESYVGKHGQWPSNMYFTPQGKKTELYSLYLRQFRGLNRTSYPVEDWDHVRFGKICEFDYSDDYLDLMDDKSISFLKSNIGTTWDRSQPAKTERRLLLELISRKKFDIREIVRTVAERRVPDDWKIVSLHPKEREFKLAARMFSMLVLEIRVFFALTEMNIANGVFPYLPQQTMTKDRLQIMKQFLSMTAPISDTDSLRMHMEIDLSRWNLKWRELVVHQVGDVINDMFDMPGVFNYTHTFFKESTVLVRVNDCKPPGIDQPIPPESDYLWRNHLGGFEGICQKLWSACTYIMIELALVDLPVSYTLVGQGDNQVLTIRTPRVPGESPYKTLARLRDILNERIPEECRNVGQEVKPEECLESTSVVTYSKDVYVNGVYHPTSLKFLSRVFPHSSQTFPSVRSNVGSIFSTALAGAEKSVNPMLCYFIACLQTSLYLRRLNGRRGLYGSYLNDRLKGKDVSAFIRFVCTLPSELAGFPIIPFTGFIYKGGSDPAGKSIASLVMLGHVNQSDRMYNRMLSQLYKDSLYHAEPNINTLLMDPFSIPFKAPVTATDSVSEMTVNALQPLVKLPEVNELMGKRTDDYLETLCAAAIQTRPFNPLMLRDLIECSVAGQATTIRKMFVATRTLQATVRKAGVNILDKVQRQEQIGLSYMVERYATLPPDPAPVESIYHLTQRLRSRWKLPGGDSIVGVTTYLPFDYAIDSSPTGFMLEGVNAVLVAKNDPYTTRGPYDPYVGSMTREKRSEHGYKIVGSNSTSQSMRKLQLISSQTGDDQGFKALIDAVGWSRTNVRLSPLSDRLTATSGGTLSHRYASRVGHLAAYNMGSPNFATHCVVSTDNCGELSGGLVDYPLMFQEFVLSCMWALSHTSLAGSKSGSITLVTHGRSFEPLPSVGVTLPPGVRIPILRFTHNPLVFLNTITLKRVSGIVNHRSLPVMDRVSPGALARQQALEAYAREVLRKNSTARVVADSAYTTFSSDTLDVAEAVSNGLTLIARSLANVVADEVIMNYVVTDAKHRTRWKAETVILKLVPFVSGIITSLIGHPLLTSDPLVQKLRLYDAPTYAGGPRRSELRFQSYVSAQALERLNGSTEYAHRVVAVFTTNNEKAGSEALFTKLLVTLYSSYRRREIGRSTLIKVVGARVLPQVRGIHKEEDRLASLSFLCADLSQQFRDMNRPILSQELNEIFHGRRLRGYKMSVKDVLKSTRNVEVWGNTAYDIRRSPKLKTTVMGLTPSAICSHRHQVVMTGYREFTSSSNPMMQRIPVLLFRCAGRYQAGTGSALHYWAPFSTILSQKPLILIGVGHGAVARVALDAGCPGVIGLDLRDSIPMRAHRFRSYIPPLVRPSERADRFSWASETFTTSGDWWDKKVSDKVLLYDSGPSTVLIDIESSEERYGMELIAPVTAVKKSGLIIVRLFLSGQETNDLCADMRVSGLTFDVYHLDPPAIVGSRVFVIRSWSTSLVVTEGCNHGPSPNYQPLPLPEFENGETVSESKTEVLMDATFNLMTLDPAVSIDNHFDNVMTLIETVSGSYDSRFGYAHWTTLLRAALSLQFCMLRQEEVIPTLEKWLTEKEALLAGAAKEYKVKVDRRLIRHLCTVASRLRIDDNPNKYLESVI